MKELTAAQKRKRRIRINMLLRAFIQLFFFLSMPGAFVAGFSGAKNIFEHIAKTSVLEWNSFVAVLVGLSVFTVLFGRFFCGYVCAFGSFGDAIFALSGLVQKKVFKRKKQITLPDKLVPVLQKAKYGILAAILILCALGIYGKLGKWSPWPVFSFFVALKFQLNGYLIGFILLLLIMLGMAFKERFFCQFLCPMGAIFALLPQLPFAELKRDEAQCIKGCQLCKKQCPVGIKLEADGFLNGECIACEKCAGTCPKANITRWDRKLFRHEAFATLVKAILFFLMGTWLGLSRL